MFGIIFSLIAGLSMTIQGVFNTKASDKIGLGATNVLVQGLALITALVALFFTKDANFAAIGQVNKLYLTGGIIGALITFAVMKGIGSLGASVAVAIILFSQLLSAAFIDGFGLFGTEVVKFTWIKIAGIILMLIGIVLMKLEFK